MGEQGRPASKNKGSSNTFVIWTVILVGVAVVSLMLVATWTYIRMLNRRLQEASKPPTHHNIPTLFSKRPKLVI